MQDSFIKELQQNIQTDNRPNYQILDRIYNKTDAIFEESTIEFNIKLVRNNRLKWF